MEPPSRQSPAATRPLIGTVTPKLRDSCHSCSASKVKCNREKPTCARCAKKRQPCEYLVTRRAGRSKPNPGRGSTIHVKHHSTVPSSAWSVSAGSETSSFGPASLTTASTAPSSPSPGGTSVNTADYPDLLLNFLPSNEQQQALVMEPFIADDFDNLLASPVPFADFAMAQVSTPMQTPLFAPGKGLGILDTALREHALSEDPSLASFEEAVFDFSTIASTSPPTSRPSLTATPEDTPSLLGDHLDPSYSCLPQALALLQQLFPHNSQTCSRSPWPTGDDAAAPPTLQAVIAENGQAIEAISKMLQCHCSRDSYLLTILSLVVFKVLGWYAAASRHRPSCGREESLSPGQEHFLQAPTVVGGYCVDGEDQGRMAGQLVLSELHRVQRLINQLSQRFKAESTGEVWPTTSEGDIDLMGSSAGFERRLPFSSALLGQLETDLRKRLRGLSLEIVDALRRG